MNNFILYTLDKDHKKEVIRCNESEIKNDILFTIEYIKDESDSYTFILEKYDEETSLYKTMRKYKQDGIGKCFFKGKNRKGYIYYTRIPIIGKYRIRILDSDHIFYFKTNK